MPLHFLPDLWPMIAHRGSHESWHHRDRRAVERDLVRAHARHLRRETQQRCERLRDLAARGAARRPRGSRLATTGRRRPTNRRPAPSARRSHVMARNPEEGGGRSNPGRANDDPSRGAPATAAATESRNPRKAPPAATGRTPAYRSIQDRCPPLPAPVSRNTAVPPDRPVTRYGRPSVLRRSWPQ